jgi:hypothetical protein
MIGAQAVLSNRPFAKKVLIGYFEMTVISAGGKGLVAPPLQSILREVLELKTSAAPLSIFCRIISV